MLIRDVMTEQVLTVNPEASIFDVARRIFDSADTKPGDTFLIGGFGPGITAELAVGTWR